MMEAAAGAAMLTGGGTLLSIKEGGGEDASGGHVMRGGCKLLKLIDVMPLDSAESSAKVT